MTDDEIIEWAVANGIEFHPVKQQVRVGFHALAGTDSMPALRRLCVMAAAKERDACAKAALDTSQVVSDEELAKAFAGTDFGGADHRNELHVAVLKKASGYHCGHTITTIMRELRLIGASGLPTKKGRKLISLAYHALMVGGP